MNAVPAMADAERGLNRPNLQEILEALAAKVHAAWVQQRKAEGWTWGKVYSGDLKHHPCLVDYEQLPESEKEVDRRTARTSIQGLLDSGFEILPPQRTHADEAEHFAPFLQRLGSTAMISLAELRALWSQCKSSPFRCPAEIHLRLGERMLRQGEAILAYDVLSGGLNALDQGDGAKESQGSLRLRVNQLLALALAQSGASERSKGILLKLCAQGFATPETLGLLGRVYKNLAGKEASPSGRSECLEQSYTSYFSGFEKADAAARLHGKDTDAADACYCGINAAAVQVLRNRTAEARMLAHRVRQICLDRSHQVEAGGGRADYWLAATLAEAELIGGRYAEAEVAYRAAVELVQGNWRELCSTRRQARLLAAPLGLAPGFVEGLFPLISIVVFAAPALARMAEEGTMREWEQRQKNELKQRLAEAGVVCGYASALSPADLLFIETMLETDREINVVLPCPRQVCRRVFESAPAWAARFDRLLSKVNLVTEDTQPGGLDETVNRAFARLRAHGAGLLRAQRLDVALHVWAMEDARSLDPRQNSSIVLSSFESLPCPYETIKEEPWLSPAGPARPANGAVRGESYAIRAMLFGDVKGYSKLSDVELFRFAQVFMQRVADVFERHSARILSRRTAGDGLFLVFADLEVAAAVALQLRDMVASARWDECGLPPNLGIRISLDAGPVYIFEDPVTEHDEVCGAYVNRAARIEPITPPNEVYASEAFASLSVAAGGRAFRFDYVGQTELPKGFGLTPLYCVNQEGV
jgi:class 3 adenylate cyclase